MAEHRAGGAVGEAVAALARAGAVLAGSLELAPFGKVLFSSGAAGPAELHYLGTLLWRGATADVLGGWAESGGWSAADAIRVAEMIGYGNARRVYRLPGAEARCYL
jgi:predicted TIM-barrel fold metal-dependent hydrolase